LVREEIVGLEAALPCERVVDAERQTIRERAEISTQAGELP